MRRPRIRTQLASLCVSIGLVLSSCAVDSPVGSYSIDAAKTAEALGSAMGAVAKAVKVAEQMLPEHFHCRLELRRDATATLVGGMEMPTIHERWHVTGTWALEGGTLTITGIEGGTKNKVTLKMTYKDGVVAVQLPDSMKIIFRRSE